MEKEKFTKEEIETTKKIWGEYCGVSSNRGFNSFNGWLDSLLKPETKKIIFEVETGDKELALKFMNQFGKIYNFTVTELPEVFTREDVKKIFTAHFSSDGYIEILINEYLERSNDNG